MSYSNYGSAFGEPRFGNPKTDEERMATHYSIYSTTDLPPRGTGLKKLSTSLSNGKGFIFFLGFFFGAIIGYAWAKPKVAVRKVREIKGAIRK